MFCHKRAERSSKQDLGLMIQCEHQGVLNMCRRLKTNTWAVRVYGCITELPQRGNNRTDDKHYTHIPHPKVQRLEYTKPFIRCVIELRTEDYWFTIEMPYIYISIKYLSVCVCLGIGCPDLTFLWGTARRRRRRRSAGHGIFRLLPVSLGCLLGQRQNLLQGLRRIHACGQIV